MSLRSIRATGSSKMRLAALRLLQHAPRRVGHGHVDHAAVHYRAGAALPDRRVERLEHAPVVVELGLAWAVEPVARLDLRRMDELAAAIAEAARQRGVPLEPFRIAHIGEHAVKRRVEAGDRKSVV